MNVDLYKKILKNIQSYEKDTIYSMYCDEFELPDSLDTQTDLAKLQSLFFRIIRCLENAQENLLFYEKFTSKKKLTKQKPFDVSSESSLNEYTENNDGVDINTLKNINKENPLNKTEKNKDVEAKETNRKPNSLSSFFNSMKNLHESSDSSIQNSETNGNDKKHKNENNLKKRKFDSIADEEKFVESDLTNKKIVINNNSNKDNTKKFNNNNSNKDNTKKFNNNNSNKDNTKKFNNENIKIDNTFDSEKSLSVNDENINQGESIDNKIDEDSSEDEEEEFKQRNSVLDEIQQEKLLKLFGSSSNSTSTTNNKRRNVNTNPQAKQDLGKSSKSQGPKIIGNESTGLYTEQNPDRSSIPNHQAPDRMHHEMPKPKSFEVVTKDEMNNAIELEMTCIDDLQNIITKYMIEHYEKLKKKFVFFCPQKKINKSILLIEQAFIIICKCKIITSIWRSVSSDIKLYEYRSLDFEFVKHFKLCYSTKKIQQYSVNELLCSLRLLGESFISLYFTKELQLYVEMLFTRCAFICSYAYPRNIHNIIKYREKVDNEEQEDTESANTENQQELYIPNKKFIVDMSIFFYSFNKMIENRTMFNTVTIHGLDHIFNKSHSKPIIDYFGKCTSSLTLKNFDPRVHYNRSILDDTYYITNDLKDDQKYILQQFQEIFKNLSFQIKSLDHLKICFFINDEIVKFYSEANIAFKIYKWFQSKTDTIENYGEKMMKQYFKMCLSFDLYVGEGQLFSIHTKTTNKTIENAIRTSRGLMVFNKIQEAAQKRAQEILPNPTTIFSDFKNIYDEKRFAEIINLRHENNNDTNKSESKENLKVKYEKVCKINNNLAEFMFDEKTLFQKSFFSIKQNLFCIKIIASFFQNQYKIDFESKFVYYFKEIHEQYESFTRSKYPLLVQTFNTFNIYYQNNVYELENFMCAFYIWLRIIDKFHQSEIEGISIESTYQIIFKNTDFYNEKCRKSYKQIIETQLNQNKELIKNRKKERKQIKEEEKQKEFEKSHNISYSKRKKKGKKIKIQY